MNRVDGRPPGRPHAGPGHVGTDDIGHTRISKLRQQYPQRAPDISSMRYEERTSRPFAT
ncbi:hypothetical protein [Mycobacterium sp. 141]|uniref:hypothetical protein n=1 Tax=Mycobacterium sp. 141 TaxID=1120797 RepID=UPI0012DE75FC|nr:hypothetical protein [Mycobacterium sp. 141]